MPRPGDGPLLFAIADLGPRDGREDFAYVDTGRAAVQAEREALLSAPLESPTGDPYGAPATERPAGDADGRTPSADGTAGDERDDDPDAGLDAHRPLEFQPLPTEQWRLAETADRLRRNGRFDTLVHTAWRQPVYGPDEETSLDLARIAAVPARLGGTASLYVTRFLHLKLDLDLAHLAAPAPGTDTLIYHLSERRKMRSTELHFFDHPRFGVLALISPVDDALPEARTTETPDAG